MIHFVVPQSERGAVLSRIDKRLPIPLDGETSSRTSYLRPRPCSLSCQFVSQPRTNFVFTRPCVIDDRKLPFVSFAREYPSHRYCYYFFSFSFSPSYAADADDERADTIYHWCLISTLGSYLLMRTIHRASTSITRITTITCRRWSSSLPPRRRSLFLVIDIVVGSTRSEVDIEKGTRGEERQLKIPATNNTRRAPTNGNVRRKMAAVIFC